jgi:hypothetical protein
MTSQQYRSKAVECLESAPWVRDTSAKNALIEMALYWLRLADLHEANHGLIRVTERIAGGSNAAKVASRN